MEQPKEPAKNARQKLMQNIMDLGAKAYSPDASESTRAEGLRELDDFLQRTRTFNVIAALNILIRPSHLEPWLRAKLKEHLLAAPLRPDGVRATLEFVFSVHPSSTIKTSEASVPQKKGANITHEGLDMASRLLSVPPAFVPAEKWYSGISPQLLKLLDGAEGEELMRAASYIIGFGILGRKSSGAPGTPGWRHLAQPMLRTIKPPPDAAPMAETGDVVDLSKGQRLVAPSELESALRRLHSLAALHPNPGLCKRLLAPLLLPLWALSSWHNAQKSLDENICTPALQLLKIFLKLSPSLDTLMALVNSMGYVGGYDRQNPEWVYVQTEKGEIEITQVPKIMGSSNKSRLTFADIDQKIPKLLNIVESSFSDADIAAAVVDLLGRWLKSAKSAKKVDIVIKQEAETEEDPLIKLTEIKLLQAMMEKFPEKLATQPKHILELAGQILGSSVDSIDDDEEVISVALSLLNIIITSPGFQKSRVGPDILSTIESSLTSISQSSIPDISGTARNMSRLLHYRDELDDPSDNVPAPTDRQIEDRKTYRLAISYITASESPPPVKFEGLNLISTLITADSPVLDIPGVLVLLSSLIADAEDYINLQVIKLYTLLASKHPKAVTSELLDHYVDPKETASVDARLRYGEALLQVVERLGETFTGDVAHQVADALLAVAGRRGHRPKTEAKQAREAKVREQKNKEAEDAWGGEVPDLSDDIPAEERARNEVLSAIVEGWESKRGTEDVRIRASALSVLGTAMETNVAGIGAARVAAAVDLAVSVLQIETEMEKGILRRAAILLVMSFVKALDRAKEEGRRLGFGFGAAAQEDVARTLGYVAQTDGDGLVRQHAVDVMESLENWKMRALVPEERGVQDGGLTRLAGLEIDPDRKEMLGGRPRIEEIE